MKKRTAELILQDPEKFAHHDRVFLNNPVVMQGMGLAPLVVVATTGQNSLEEEYNEAKAYMEELGIIDGYTQAADSSDAVYIPAFNGAGVREPSKEEF